MNDVFATIWTDHARSRMAERFPGIDLRFADESLQRLAEKHQDGDVFKLRLGHIEYVCNRWNNAVMVRTVILKEPKPKKKHGPNKTKQKSDLGDTLCGTEPFRRRQDTRKNTRVDWLHDSDDS